MTQKNIPVYYYYQNEDDQILNVYAFQNIWQQQSDIKIKHVLQNFPHSLDNQHFHFRFKTICEEKEPKIYAWIDISNLNAKAPILNGAIYMKILTFKDNNRSKIYTKNKLLQLKKSKQDQSEQQDTLPLNAQKNQNNVNGQSIIASQVQSQHKSHSTDDNLLDFENDIKVNTVTNQKSHLHKASSDNNLYEFEFDNKASKPSTLQADTNHNNYIQQVKSNSGTNIDQQTNTFSQESGKYQFIQQNNQQQIPQNLWEEDNLQEESKQIERQEELFQREILVQQKKQLVEKSIQEKQQKQTDQLREQYENEENKKKDRQEAKIKLQSAITSWSSKDKERKNIRTLLASLHEILWENSGWEPIELSSLLDDNQVKKTYVKAIRLVHPDRHQGRDPEQRYIAEQVFFEINEAWKEHCLIEE